VGSRRAVSLIARVRREGDSLTEGQLSVTSDQLLVRFLITH
jgi:hypothetical protein